MPADTYYLFSGLTIYPSGGLFDLSETFEADSTEEALEKVRELVGDYDPEKWWQLVRLGGSNSLRIVEQG